MQNKRLYLSPAAVPILKFLDREPTGADDKAMLVSLLRTNILEVPKGISRQAVYTESCRWLGISSDRLCAILGMDLFQIQGHKMVGGVQ